jgi:adhesin transport system membrane fusion protein
MNSPEHEPWDHGAEPERGARITLWTAIAGLTLLTLWAAWAEIDQVTRAQGQVIAVNRTQIVQTADGGVLRQLKVSEGEHVKSGQLLATLEKTRVQAAVADSRAKVAALKITLARLKAEVYGTPLKFDPKLNAYPEYIKNQRNLYNKRKKAFVEDIAALSSVRKAARQELSLNKQLELSKDVSRVDILRLERQIAEIDVQITNKRNKFFQDAQAEMTKAQEELNTQLEVLNDKTQLLDQTDLLAPADGVVKNIKVTTLGGVLRAGDVVMEILPTSGDLIVEAKVYPADIAFVRPDQEAVVKLDAWDASIFGGFKGTVKYVSPDTLIEETQRGPVPYYRVHVAIGDKELVGEVGHGMEVRPGMTAQVDIKAYQRSVLSYILNPVSKTFKDAFKGV